MTRYNPDFLEGLTNEQVKERYDHNLVNSDTEVPTKTIPTIIKTNVLTLFNFLNLGLGLAIFFVQSYKNLTFLIVVLCNTLIGTWQEIMAKRAVDKLSIIANRKIKTIRNSKEIEINHEEIVIDDVLLFNIGNQIVVDSIILNGDCEVDESFITGESEYIYKKKGDMLLSGSFVVSGKCYAKVEHIGYDNYTYKISKDAKYIKKINSELMNSLNKIIKLISFVIIPLGLLMFWKQFTIPSNTLESAVVNTVASVLGMIPEGLILLTSTVLAVSVIRLSKYHLLIQQLYCIETLARVDVLCLDKTGTITDGNMEIIKLVPLDDCKEKEMLEVLSVISKNIAKDNATSIALANNYENYNDTNWEVNEVLPFSSKKKWSGMSFNDHGSYILGAPEFILNDEINRYNKVLNRYNKEYRVLLLAHSNSAFRDKNLPLNIEVMGLIIIQDKVRDEARLTLKYFRNQAVNIKIISGDNVNTVKAIAKRVGLDDCKEIDMSKVTDDVDYQAIVEKYQIFGRVTPEQKKKIVLALKANKHMVAMTGDGVNDVLALKEADCSIAMASGSDAARNVAQIVLLESNFDTMPLMVAEGRRVINNVERSATLFLVKTTYATLLALLFLFVEVKYPFIPIQFTLISMVTIGIPSFILALESNHDRIKGGFLTNVFGRSIPGALTIFINIILILILNSVFPNREMEISTIAVFLTAFTSFLVLYQTSLPFNKNRNILFSAMVTLFILQVIFFRNFYSLAILNLWEIIVLIILIVVAYLIYRSLSIFIRKILIRKFGV